MTRTPAWLNLPLAFGAFWNLRWEQDLCWRGGESFPQPSTLNSQPTAVVGYSSGQRGQTVNLLAYAYEGSNPSPTTTFIIHNNYRGLWMLFSWPQNSHNTVRAGGSNRGAGRSSIHTSNSPGQTMTTKRSAANNRGHSNQSGGILAEIG